MSGPTAWPQIQSTFQTGTQAITTTTETVIATLSNINSRGSNFPINLVGSAVFAISAATTATTLRIRQGTVTGAVVGTLQVVTGGVAGDMNAGDGTVSATFTPSGEIANATFVLTIQATAAAANWNVTNAALTAQQ